MFAYDDLANYTISDVLCKDYSFKKAMVTRGIYCKYLELPFMATTIEFTCLRNSEQGKMASCFLCNSIC